MPSLIQRESVEVQHLLQISVFGDKNFEKAKVLALRHPGSAEAAGAAHAAEIYNKDGNNQTRGGKVDGFRTIL